MVMQITKISVNPVHNANQRQITKKDISFQGQKQKLIKRGLELGGTLSASALFMLAQNEVKTPSAIVNEFYENENKKLGHNRANFHLKRFSEEEKYVIGRHFDNIDMHPTAFRRIIDAKNDDNTFRFGAEDSVSLFYDAGEEIEKFPEVFKKVLKTKDKDGENRFDYKDCVLLMKNAELFNNYPKAFDLTLAIQELDAEECRKLILNFGESIENNPQILVESLQATQDCKKDENYYKVLSNTVDKKIKEKEAWRFPGPKDFAQDKTQRDDAANENLSPETNKTDVENAGKLTSEKDVDVQAETKPSKGNVFSYKDENGNTFVKMTIDNLPVDNVNLDDVIIINKYD